MNWIFKPSINVMDIIIIVILHSWLTELFGFWWGLLFLVPFLILSNEIQTKIWKVTKS